MNAELETLVVQAQKGRREAVDLLLLHEQQRIFAISYHLLGRREEAEEAAQEALLRIFTRLDQLHTPASFQAWSARIAANLCRDRLRRRPFPCAALDAAAELSGGLDPVLEAGRSEVSGQLQGALARLSPVLRLAVLLRDVEGLSYEEVAGALDIPLGTVKSRLSEGRRQLRENLRHQGVVSSYAV